MANKINLDFGSALSQIEHLKSSTEAFSNVLKSLIGEVSKFGPAVQQAMTGISSFNLQTTPLSSPTGSNVELLSQVREKMQTNQQTLSNFFKENPDAVNIGGGRFRVSGAFGTKIINLSDLYNEQRELKQQEEHILKKQQDFNFADEQRDINKNISNLVYSKQRQSSMPLDVSYDISNLPSLIAASQRIGTDKEGDLKRISDTIKSLQESGDKNSQIFADILKNISLNLKTAQSEFQQALQEYQSEDIKSSPDRQIKAMERLTAAMENLDRNIEQAKNAERSARRLPGGGGGPTDGGEGPTLFGMPIGRASRVIGGIGAATAVGFSTLRFAQDLSIALGRGVIGGEIDRLMTQGQMSERQFSDVFSAYDFTKIENIMRFRGDLLTGGRSRFLGPEGFQRALDLVRERQALEFDLLRQERTRDLISGVGGALGRGLAVGTAAAIAGSAIPGIGTIAGFISGFAGGALSATPGIVSNYLTSPATQLEGLNQGLLGTAGAMAYGPRFNQLAIEKQQALIAKINLDNYNQARALQDAEMQRYRPLMVGYQEIMNTIQAQQEGVSLVGTYAVRGMEDIVKGVSHYSAYSRERERERQRLEAIRDIETEKYRIDLKNADDINREASENAIRAYDKFDRMVLGRTQTRAAGQRDLVTPRTVTNQMVARQEAALLADAQLRAFEATPVSYARMAPLSVHAQLEMNRADFQRHRNQLTNFLGFGITATEDQTARMIQLSRSGLGDFSALLGNLAGLNRAVGGFDNTRTLEIVLGNAIAAGFDKSRTAQMFTQTAISLAEQTGITNIGAIAQSISIGAAGMSVSRRPDERSLGLAAKGFADFAQYTANVGGPSGILGTLAAIRGGIGFGQGAGILMGRSVPELQQMLEEVRSGNFTNPRTASLLRLSGLSREELPNVLQQIINAKNAPILALIQNRTGVDISDLIRNINPQNLDEQFIRVMDIAREAGMQIGLGEEGTMAFVANQISLNANPDVISRLNERVRRAQRLFRDPTRQQLQAFIDSLTSNAIVQDRLGASGRITEQDRKTYFEALRFGMEPVKVDGVDITEEAYRAGSAAFKEKADKQLMNLSRFEIARTTQAAAALADTKVQQVWVMNATDIGHYVGRALAIQEPKTKIQ